MTSHYHQLYFEFNKKKLLAVKHLLVISINLIFVLLTIQFTEAALMKNDNRSEHFSVFVFDDKIENFIKELIKDEKLSAKISRKVRGKVIRRKLIGSRDEILNKISKEFNFEWFVYDRTLYISNRSETTTRVIALDKLKMENVLNALKAAGLQLDRFPIRNMADRKTFIISGPPSYVALVETIISSLQAPKGKTVPKLGNFVTVYKGSEKFEINLD